MSQSSFDFAIEEIKRRLSLVDLAETYISLKKSGKNYIGLCPFHDDKNPSLYINEEKGLYHCFSCGAGGDIFSFFMNHNNVSFKEAVQELASKLNIEIKEGNLKKNQKSSKRLLQLKVNQSALKFFHNSLLKNKDSQVARDYLASRGISIDLAKKFKIGFASNNWEGLLNYFLAEKVPLEIPIGLGLIHRNENRKSFYDTFRNRIIFPIIDVNGDVIGFGARAVNKNDKPKYLNSPESDIYKKRKSFYGLFYSKDHIKKQNLAILVEGYMDFLSLYVAGVKNVIATLGTSFALEHASNLKRYTNNVVILYDGDDSGQRASVKSGELLLQAGIIPKLVRLPEGFDPDLIIREKGVKAIMDLIDSSRELTDYFIDNTYKNFKENVIDRSEAAQQLVNFGEKITNRIDRTHFIHKISSLFGFRESDLHSMFDITKRHSFTKDRVNNKKITNGYEMLILKICLHYPELIDRIDREFVFKYVSDDNIKKILAKIISTEFEDISMIINSFNEQETKLILSRAVFSSDEIHGSNSKEKMLEECVNRLKLKKVREQLVLKRGELNKISSEKSSVNEKELIKDYRNLLEQEQRIKGELHEI